MIFEKHYGKDSLFVQLEFLTSKEVLFLAISKLELVMNDDIKL